MSIRQKKLPITALERIDDLCAEFEDAWQRQTPPTIESLLPKVKTAEEREVLFAELLALEIDYRRRSGEQPAADQYLQLYPDDSEIVHQAFSDAIKPASNSRFEPPAISRLATLFPTLDIIELIGAGGMGAVYKARQKGLDRIVAIKVLPEELGHDAKFALRFTREARALARLNHPNIVSVFEFGHAGDIYYFLMEYVDGANLREVLHHEPLRPEKAMAFIPFLCDALQYAHDQGVVHRDIKPENILITKDCRVKIADFGLSRLVGSEGMQDMLTATHQVMGTPRYMAPEQLEDSHKVDHRADIYSMGVVFYEMLTGELPIGRFSAPSEKVKIDVRLDDVVLRTLEKEPQRRYQHASQVKSDVESITSSDVSNLNPTVEFNSKRSATNHSSNLTNLERQEMAGRLVLVRRQLMGQVEKSLRPLFWGQLLQIIVGIAIVALGAYCWTQNKQIPHRLFSGIVLHAYGTLMAIAAGALCIHIKRLDYSKPVREIRNGLDRVRKMYLRFGLTLGFAWWLLWIPVSVAVGFDEITKAVPLTVSLLIGGFGLLISIVAVAVFQKSKNRTANRWSDALAGNSLADAYRSLREIEDANIG